MQDDNLPVKRTEDFIAEFEVMKLDHLSDKTYIVAVNKGERGEGKFLSNTVHGPYNFFEMCESVGMMWREHQHHAKVVALSKDLKKQIEYLDENTIDYIEAHFEDIVFNGVFEQVLTDDQYTCKAKLITEQDERDNPLIKKDEPKQLEAKNDDKQDNGP